MRRPGIGRPPPCYKDRAHESTTRGGNRLNPAFLGIATASIWGVHDLVAGVTSRRIGFLPTVLGSTFFGFAALTGWLAVDGTYPALIQDRAWIAYGSGFGYALATMCLFAALSSGPMSLGVPLAGSYPITSLVLSAAAGVVPTALQLSLALTVVLGVVLVSMTADSSSPRQQFPEGWFRRTLTYGLSAHVLFAFAIWSGQLAAVRFGGIETTWLARLSGLVLLVLILAVSRDTLKNKASYLPTLGMIGLLDVLAISCLNYAANTAHPEIATVIGSTFGPVTVLLAWIFLKERISGLTWLGIVITFSAVAALSATG